MSHPENHALAPAPRFDQRPGAFEATRVAVGSLSVLGRRTSGVDGKWRVLCLLRAEGMIGEVELTADEARQLADTLNEHADVIDGSKWG